MDIVFKKFTINDEIIRCLVKWYNDKEIFPYLHPNFEEEEHIELTESDIKKTLIDMEGKTRYTIYDENKPIGELAIIDNFPYLYKSTPKSAWVSICVGDKDYWGKGVAKTAMKFLEDECKANGYSRIELGVFEHNVKARNLYIKLGYKEINIYPHFTYYNGEWYADIRMEKYIGEIGK